MNSRSTFDRVVSVAFALSAIVVAAVVVTVAIRREFFPSGPEQSESIAEPVRVENWEALIASGHSIGPLEAPATILVFSDFECPACRQFALGPLREIRGRYGDEVRVIHRHWPLPYHRFAYPAARASECAGAQGRFEAYHDLLFEKQDSLGLKTFTEFAVESGVPNIPAFEECNSETEPLTVITADSAAARAVGGTGTPTVLINGLRLPRTILLAPLVQAAIAGELEAPPSEQGTVATSLTQWDSAPELRLEPEGRVDGASAGLTRIGAVAVSQDGSMAVSQPESSSLVVFDARGVRVGRFGRNGSGVGEFSQISQFGWLGDTLWIYDLPREQLAYGSPPDRIVRTAPLPRQAVPEPSSAEGLAEAYSRIHPLAVYEDGSIYASSTVPGELPELPVSGTVRRYVRINAAGEVSRVVSEVPGAPYVRLRTATGSHAASIPFLRGALHEVSAGGSYVATVHPHIEGPHGGRFEVVLQGALGDTVYARDYPFVGIPIPPSLADSVLKARVEAMGSRELARLLREEAPVPPVYPPVSTLVVGNDGLVWIGLRAVGNERIHLVLDPRGVPSGVAKLSESARVVAAEGPSVWIVERDPNGVESVVRYRVEDRDQPPPS